jgi:hypothetical protein
MDITSAYWTRREPEANSIKLYNVVLKLGATSCNTPSEKRIHGHQNVRIQTLELLKWQTGLTNVLLSQFLPDLLGTGECYEDEQTLKSVQHHEHVPQGC